MQSEVLWVRPCGRRLAVGGFGIPTLTHGVGPGADVGRAGVGEVLLGRLYERKGHSQEARKEASC
jgi:hypothetical protein